MDFYISDAILKTIDPSNDFTGYTKGWAFTEFHTAISIALGYLAFVIVGKKVMESGVPAMDPYPIKSFTTFHRSFSVRT